MHRTERQTEIRRSLRLSRIEGMVAELVGACSSGAVFTAWALWLGMSPFALAALGAMKECAQLVQFPAARLTSKLGARRVALVAVSASRQALLPLVLLPLLPIGRAAQQGVLLAVAALAAVLGAVGNNAWTHWMGDLVPARVRARYFGVRAATCTLGATAASLLVGALLDFGRRSGGTPYALTALSCVACGAGAVTSWLLSRQHDPAAPHEPPPALPAIFSDASKRLLAYQLCWSAAGGLASSFYSVYLVTALGGGYVLLAVYNAGIGLVRTATAPLWGRAIHRAGARPVLLVSSLALCAPPLIWAFLRADLLWPLALDVVVTGVAMAGQSLASFHLPLAEGAREERPFRLAAFCTAGGLSTAAASLCGGAILPALPDGFRLFGAPHAGLHALFFLSAAGRAGAGLLASRIVEPRARPLRAMFTPALRSQRAAINLQA